MSALVITITDAGRAALVNAAHTGTQAVTIAGIGISAQHVTATSATTALPGEIKRLTTLSGQAVADDTVHITVRDDSDSLYSLRSFGLYLDDGTLWAVYGQFAPILEKSAASMLLLSVDIRLVDVEAGTITFGNADFLNPPATTWTQGVVELATDAEAWTGTDTTRAMTPAATRSAYLPLTGGTVSGLLQIAHPSSGESCLDLIRPEGQRSVRWTTTQTGDTGVYSITGQHWLLRIDAARNAHFAGTVTATGFVGNAGTASKLHTARTINGTPFDGSAAITTATWGTPRTLTIGQTAKPVDGSDDVTWTPEEIGHSAAKAFNGWMKHPTGIIEQWGVFMMATTGEAGYVVTFPVAFPTGCWNVIVCDINAATPEEQYLQDMYVQVIHETVTHTGFSVFVQGPAYSGFNWSGMYWRAIGF